MSFFTYRHPIFKHYKTGKPPVLIGPCWVHQSRTEKSYLDFALSLKHIGVGDLQSYGTDGDVNIARAFNKVFRQSTHFYCEIHVRDNIEKKIKELNFNADQYFQINRDLFGLQEGEKKAKGLVDTYSIEEFDVEYEKFIDKLDKMGDSGRKFIEYFRKNKYQIFREHMRADIRLKFNLGDPPESFTNNGNESMNALLKLDLKGKKLTMSEFILHYESTIEKQQNKIESLLTGNGSYSIDDKFLHVFPTSRTCANLRSKIDLLNKISMNQAKEPERPIFQSYGPIEGVDNTVAKLMYEKAYSLSSQPGKILRNPAVDETQYLIPSVSQKGVLNDVLVKGDKITCNCPHFKSVRVCSHVLALCMAQNIVKEFLLNRENSDHGTNLENLINGDLSDRRGSKPTKNTQIRKGTANRNKEKVTDYV